MAGAFKAELVDLVIWANGVMASRPPDFVIGDDYLRRWWILPRNDFMNLYLHQVRHSDDDRAMHDHPWPSTSLILDGGYLEHTPDGVFERRAGDVTMRQARDTHRLEVMPGTEGALTLFATGPKMREWGFDCPHGWVHWMDFTNPEDTGQVGRGCGEHDDLSPVTKRGAVRGTEIALIPKAEAN